MKKVHIKMISLLTVGAVSSSMLAGCFGSNSGSGTVLSVPNQGQQYSVRTICNQETLPDYEVKSVDDGYILINNSLVFDNNGNNVYDISDICGGMEPDIGIPIIWKESFWSMSGGKIIGGDEDGSYLIDVKSGDKKYSEAVRIIGSYSSDYYYKDGLFYWKNGEWGVMDEDGNELIPSMYDAISPFDSKGNAVVYSYSERKYGTIDRENNLVIPMKYSGMATFDGTYIESTFGSGIYSDDYGATYDYTLTRTYDKEAENTDDGYIYTTVNRSGETVFDITAAGYTMNQSTFYLGSNLIPVEKGEVYGFIDMQGNEVIPLKYNGISSGFVNGYAVVRTGSYAGVINTKDETIIPFQYSSISPFDSRGFAIATKDSGAKSIIDLAGNEIYTSNSAITDSTFAASTITALGDGYFEINENGVKSLILISTDTGTYETYVPKIYKD